MNKTEQEILKDNIDVLVNNKVGNITARVMKVSTEQYVTVHLNDFNRDYGLWASDTEFGRKYMLFRNFNDDSTLTMEWKIVGPNHMDLIGVYMSSGMATASLPTLRPDVMDIGYDMLKKAYHRNRKISIALA